MSFEKTVIFLTAFPVYFVAVKTALSDERSDEFSRLAAK